jgi:hypothetical protein
MFDRLRTARKARELADTRKVMPSIIDWDYPNRYNGGPCAQLGIDVEQEIMDALAAEMTAEIDEKRRRQQELLDDALIVYRCIRISTPDPKYTGWTEADLIENENLFDEEVNHAKS